MATTKGHQVKRKSFGYQGTNAKAIMIQEEMHKRKIERHHDYWCYAGVATIAFSIGAYLGVLLTNGTWSWS